MTVQSDFYRARAIDARADADAASLDNVHDRCLRSAEAWDSMADRAVRTGKMRDRLEAEKAGRLAAEPAEPVIPA